MDVSSSRRATLKTMKKLCECGCGQPLKNNYEGRRRRFATNACRQRTYRWRQAGSESFINQAFRNKKGSADNAEPRR